MIGLKSRLQLRGVTLVRNIIKPNTNFSRNKSFFTIPPPPKKNKRYEHLPNWRQWAAYLGENEAQKKATKYYVAGFGVVCVCFYYYMRDKFYEDQQSNLIKAKFLKDPDSLTEYEHLRLKLICGEALKSREEKLFRMYLEMRKEFFRKSLARRDDLTFLPTEEDLAAWYDKQPKRVMKKAPVGDATTENGVVEEKVSRGISNKENPNIMEAHDTTEFFDEKAEAYDAEVNWEERAVLMGMRRRETMSWLDGDVLEVSCGTGRNIDYLNLEKVDSITFLDSSEKMVEITRDKFKEKHPKFRKAAFTVGKAEDLVELAGLGPNGVKYDTIVETFGLCSHEDPVKALENMKHLLRPGGRIVLLEHGRSTWDMINNHLDFRADKRMKTWACRWNLDIGELIEDAGLDITYEKRVHFGTTWMLVCKKPEDPIRMDEKTFLQKLFGRGPRIE